jgi:anaerobic magnesium-protoporphyrin IX monomethyl ester cyclase
MRILLVNPPHPAIGSRIPNELLPPLGLLYVGGALIDAGHEVELLNADFGPMPTPVILARIMAFEPEAVLFGHPGSTSAHSIICEITRGLRGRGCEAFIIYGGVFPTYHWQDVLAAEPQIDVIVRGEGEETTPRLLAALADGMPLEALPGIAFRRGGIPCATQAAPMIADLDACRIGWELIDHADYSYWGGKRAVVIQFSRGCPHLCNYCGQRGFWTRWRHRDPGKLAAEMGRLHREHGVEVFNFADENPSASKKAWQAFLEAVIAENIKVTLVASTRAGDIVRDADILPLYKKAGFERFLMGMENTDEATLKLIRKGASADTDKRAIQLLRQHGILSMATWVVGFEDETDRGLWNGLKRFVSYDPDQIQTLYVTPHRWTPYFRIAADRRVIQTDRRRWDYKHQVLAAGAVPPWRLFLWVKFIEVVAQTRPRALKRLIWQPDPYLRHGVRWYYRMGRRVWFHEIGNFLFRDRRIDNGPTLAQFWGAPQDKEEEAMLTRKAAMKRGLEPVNGAE